MNDVQISSKNKYCSVELKNLLLFSAGNIISVLGTTIYSFALSLYVLKLTGSSTNFASMLIMGIIPAIIINPFAGVIADRVSRKKLVIIMNLLCALLLFLFYFEVTIYGFNLLVIYFVSFLLTVFTAFFGIAAEAAKPDIVTENMLLKINSVGRIIDSIASIMGPMLGGLFFALIAMKDFVLINAVSFIILALCEVFIDFRLNRKGENAATVEKRKIAFIEDIKAGLKYLRKTKDVKPLLGVFIMLNFFLGFSVSVPMPFIVNSILKIDSKGFGIIEGAFPFGIIIGALLVKKIIERLEYKKLLNRLCVFISLLMVAVGMPTLFNGHSKMIYLVYYIVVMTIFGITISFVDIPIAYLLQKIISEEYRGRVWSLGLSIGKIFLPVALIVSGALMNIVPAFFVPFGGGVIMLVLSVLLVYK